MRRVVLIGSVGDLNVLALKQALEAQRVEVVVMDRAPEPTPTFAELAAAVKAEPLPVKVMAAPKRDSSWQGIRYLQVRHDARARNAFKRK